MSAFGLSIGMLLLGLGVLAPQAAQAATVGFSSNDPNVTITAGGSNCNGVIPPHKTDTDTAKTLTGFDNDPNKPTYAITYNVGDNSGAFNVLDCMLTGNAGDDLKDMTVVAEATMSGVNNSQAFNLNFMVDLTALNAQIGQQVCNVAKTTAGPSAGPSGVRKAAAACFVVGGDQRVEKRDATTGNVVTGGTPATFRVACVNSAVDPALQPVLVNTTPVPATGVNVQANTLAFNGASGSTCTVKETVAPTGYQLPTAVPCAGALVPPACDTIALTIGVGTAGHVIAFNDTPAPVVVTPVTRSLTVSKTVNGGTGSFLIHTVCDDGSKADYTITQTVTEPALTGIKDGASCTVSEDDPGTGWTTTVNGNSGRSVALTMSQNRTASFVNTFTPAAVVTPKPPAEVLAEVVTKPAAAPAVAPAAAPAAPAVAAAELPKTGRELGLLARVGGVLVALGLMALAASSRKREVTASR